MTVQTSHTIPCVVCPTVGVCIAPLLRRAALEAKAESAPDNALTTSRTMLPSLAAIQISSHHTAIVSGRATVVFVGATNPTSAFLSISIHRALL